MSVLRLRPSSVQCRYEGYLLRATGYTDPEYPDATG